MIFINVIFPIFLIFAAGYIIYKKFQLDSQAISQLSFYLLLPCLVFRTLYEVDIQGDLKYIVLFQIILTIFLVLLIKVVGYLKKTPPEMLSAIFLAVVFMNAGNYGAPFNYFAFGEIGLQLAITYWVIQSVLMNSLGVYFANSSKANFLGAVTSVFKMPTVYAALLGIALQLLHVELPSYIYEPIDLLSNATIPVIMLLLGMQLAKVKISNQWGAISYGVTLRLVISPLVAMFIVLYILPVEGVLAKILILEAAMPTAVVTTLLASQYNCKPEVVSGITLSTTILSVVTLSALLFIVNYIF